MRKAIRKWVSRARVRRGLRRQVFQTAIKGKDLLLLLKMMDEADTDDLCNAVLAKDGEGCTPILWAAKKGYADVVEAFIGAGERSSGELGDASLLGQVVNSTDADGNTALHWAARKSHVYVANALMLAGADVDAQNLEQSTPLHWAARKDHVELLRLLIAAGASLTKQNKWGATALEQATSFSQARAVELLRAEEKRQRDGGGDGGDGGARAVGSSGGGGGGGKKRAPKGSPPNGGGGGSPPTAATKAAWGEGPGLKEKKGVPPALREAQAKRRAAAEKRRQEAMKAREVQDVERAKDQEVRRRRANLEARLRDLMDAASAFDGAGATGGGPRATGSNSRTKSPPKKSLMDNLSAAIKEATEIGLLPTLIEQAQEKLRGAEMRREEARQRKAQAEAKGPKGRPGEKDPNDEMAKMERKLAKKVGKR